MSATWRSISWSMARTSDRSEFRFFTSHRVPNSAAPRVRTDTLASTRIEPSSMRPSDAPAATKMPRNSAA